jgi:biopolymer transport protein ExbD
MPEQDEQFVETIDQQSLTAARSIDDSEMDITPMIDLTFLLLIFFIVAGRIDQQAPIHLPPARHGSAVSVKSSVILTVTQRGTDGADVYLGDGKDPDQLLDSSDLEAQSAAITEYVEQEIESGKETVLIKAEKGVRHRDVARVSRAVGKVRRDLYVAVLELK